MTGLAHYTDRLHPAEWLLDPLTRFLAHGVTPMTRGAPINRRAAVGIVLRDMRRTATFTASGNELGGVIVLVGPDCAARMSIVINHVEGSGPLGVPLASVRRAGGNQCGRRGKLPGVTDFPVERIKQVVQPTGDQLTALNELSAAAAKANDTIKASCPSAVPLAPVARLDTAEARTEAVVQAADVMRGPLQAFYDSLSDQQRQRFENMSSSGKRRASPGGDIAALCSRQSGDATNLPIQRIEQVVQPNDQRQHDAFAALKQASRDTANQLQASCPSQVPQTPVARLEAVQTRLQAMAGAMNTIRPKLQDFYASLSDDQKARFNTMAPPQNASAATQGSNR